MKYRLGLDVGTTSIGWAIYRLATVNEHTQPVALIRAGVRIFPNGRDGKSDKSLAVRRREARSARRRRDRLLQRKTSILRQLVTLGFFPKDETERKKLVSLNPYELRAKGLVQAITPEEFGRALFHINQRRGFKSNRKTDHKDSDSGIIKQAIAELKSQLKEKGARTVGEFLYKLQQEGLSTRMRLKQWEVLKEDGKLETKKAYDFYIERSMIEDEFEALWAKQSELNPQLYTVEAYDKLKSILLFQRPLKPVSPGRCALIPEQERAPKALPLYQNFRIYQDVNHLRYYDESNNLCSLTKEQRDKLVQILKRHKKISFNSIRKKLGFSGSIVFTIEDEKNQELEGDATAVTLSNKQLFDKRWLHFTVEQQNEIVEKLLSEESELALVEWLIKETGVDQQTAERISAVELAKGYGNLGREALGRILPKMQEDVITYSEALVQAGFKQELSSEKNLLESLPYYGQVLVNRIGFGTGNPDDTDEVRYGRISNPTVHIGLNQLRLLINALIKEYGHPSQVVVELARDLKMSAEDKKKFNKEQKKTARSK